MSDQPKPSSRSLSEISHLFLSDVRQRQTRGASPPLRIPPGGVRPPAPPAGIDPKLEDISRTSSDETLHAGETQKLDNPDEAPRRLVSVVIAQHLGESASAAVRQYARYMAAGTGRVALAEVDEHGLRLICFDAAPLGDDEPASSAPPEALDGKRVAEAIEEISWDVERWLVFLPDGTQSPEARALLEAAQHWILLSAADADGVVACYRSLKGLAELRRPALSLAVLDAASEEQSTTACRRLVHAARQFLNIALEAEAPLEPAEGIAEHLVLHCDANGADQQQWAAISHLLSKSIPPAIDRFEAIRGEDTIPKMTAEPDAEEQSAPIRGTLHLNKEQCPPFRDQNTISTGEPMDHSKTADAAIPFLTEPAEAVDMLQVLDLPGADGSSAALSAAVCRNSAAGAGWVECPVKPPMCGAAILVVGRDSRLTLLAAAGKGLIDLRSIGLAYRWLAENRSLIRMALPQFAIDAGAMPALRLFVDHADMSADILQPMFQSANVTVQAYRRVMWGPRMGLLLEAA